MLEIQDLTLIDRASGRMLTDRLSFVLNPGDRAALIGEEGNGKSTLLKVLCDRTQAESYCEISGRILLRGKAGYLPQRLPRELEQTSVAEYFADCDLYADFSLVEQLSIPAELLGSGQKLGTLSGGEKVKVQLLRLLTDRPDVLLLDEPTNDLDLPALEWFETFLSGLRQPVLYVSHDETLLENTANLIIHMEQLRKKQKCRVSVTRSGYADYVQSRYDAFRKQGQIARKQRDDYDRQMETWRQIHSRVEHEQRTISRSDPHGGRLLKKKMASVQAQGKRMERQKEQFLDIPEQEDAILTRFDPDIAIPRGKTVLDLRLPRLEIGGRTLAENVELRAVGPVHIGIIGRNGAGKSTLLKAVWQELAERRDITPGLMPQNYADILDSSLSPTEYLARRYSREDVTRARTCLGSMRFTHEEMTGRIGSLSGGQQAKLLLLDLVLRRCDVLVLDEPTRNFSPLSGPVVRQALQQFGGAILSVSHDRKYLAEVCDVIFELTPAGLRKAD